MASRALTGLGPSPRNLMTLGLFVFGMDSLPYQSLSHAMEWNHATSERFQARPAAQFLGPGAESVTISGLLVPEVAGRYSSIDRLREMADTGEDQALVDGMGRVYGYFRIVKIDLEHRNIMAGGIPRQVDFTIELERAADPAGTAGGLPSSGAAAGPQG